MPKIETSKVAPNLTATKTVSGVFYLHPFEDVKDLEKAGTELAPIVLEGEGNFFVPWKTGHWDDLSLVRYGIVQA